MPTTRELITEVKKLMEEFPETVYMSDMDMGPNGCNYITGGQNGGSPLQGCIIGQAAQRLEDQSLWEFLREDPYFQYSFADVANEFEFDGLFYDEEINWLSRVQDKQDNRVRWGDIEASIHADLENEYLEESNFLD